MAPEDSAWQAMLHVREIGCIFGHFCSFLQMFCYVFIEILISRRTGNFYHFFSFGQFIPACKVSPGSQMPNGKNFKVAESVSPGYTTCRTT